MSSAKRTRGKGAKTVALEAAILDVLASFEGSMSSRQVYYQCVSRGACENSARDTRRVLQCLVDMRRDGRVPYERIVDRTRAKHHLSSWESATEALGAVTDQFRRDKWMDQETVPMIACEKAALEGIFSQVCDLYGVSLWTLRGFNSESFEYEWAQEIRALNAAGKRVIVHYFGDHDPSGLSIEQNSRTKLQAFGARFRWRRGGLNLYDFSDFDLVRVPLKETDRRTKGYLIQFGPDAPAGELDALPPDELRARIEASILPWIDHEAWARIEREEEIQRADLEAVRTNWDAALAAARGAA